MCVLFTLVLDLCLRTGGESVEGEKRDKLKFRQFFSNILISNVDSDSDSSTVL